MHRDTTSLAEARSGGEGQRSHGYFALVTSAASLTACLADNPDYIAPPDEASAGETGSGSTSATSTSDASSATVETSTITSGTDSVGSSTGTSAGTLSTTEPTTMGACMQGEILCMAGDAYECQGDAYAVTECPGDCVEGVGCVPCGDGTLRCDGAIVLFCDTGEYFEGEECDPIQGLACADDVGCVGACSEDELFTLGRRDLGCDFYAHVTPSSIAGGSLVAVVEAGPGGATVTWSHDDQIDGTKAIPAYGSLALPDFAWEPKLGTLMPASAEGTTVVGAAHRIRSDQPVRVTQYTGIVTDMSAGGTSLWPTTSWDFDAPVAHYGGGDPLQDLAWIAVSAAWEQTTITVKLPPALLIRLGSGFAEDGSGAVVIEPGDVLLLLAQPGLDLSGARVSGDGPIQVLAGNHCAAIEGGMACDHVEESMPTLDAGGTLHLIPPALDYNGSYFPRPTLVRLLGLVDGTKVDTEPQGDSFTIDAGSVTSTPNLGPSVIHTDKPVLVFAYVSGAPNGREAFTWVPPMEGWIGETSAFVPATLGAASAILVVHQSGTTTKVDGQPLAVAGTFGVNWGTFAYSIALVPAGPHAVTSDKPFTSWLVNVRANSGIWTGLGAAY